MKKPFLFFSFFLLFSLQHGSTALVTAAARARTAIVKLLLAAGADKDARAVVRLPHAHITYV